MEFDYIVRNSAGQRISSTTTADSLPTLLAHLKKQGLIPIHVSQLKRQEKTRATRPLGGRVSGREIAVFARQLAHTLHAGLLLSDALTTIADDLENSYFRLVLEQIIKDVLGGKAFSDALSQYPWIFSTTFVATVRAGEEGGELAQTLTNLAKYLEDYERLKAKFKSAMRYPLFIFSFFVFVVGVMVFFIIPKFKAFFAQTNTQLPMLTQIVTGISETLIRNILPTGLIVVFLCFLYWYCLKLKKVRFQIDSLKLRLPFIGKVIRKVLIARFCRNLSILLSAGVTMPMAMAITSQVIDNLFLQDKITYLKKRVISGGVLSEEIKAHKIFPRMVAKMSAVGEKTGKISEMLKRSADYYDEEIEITLANLTSLIEPVFIVLIGGVVLIVVLALYLPIFNLSKAIH
ncbi:MAG: type II secretion system F family protein [Candidatus Omnitrophica bacterium]|nr:type II secretion system F family protein [Candidatus Omnitrophota bacterium]